MAGAVREQVHRPRPWKSPRATGVRRAVLRFGRARVERATVGQASCFVVQEEVRCAGSPESPREVLAVVDQIGKVHRARAICSRIPDGPSSGYATVSLELMPTVRSPSAASTISPSSRSTWRTYGQWLQTKTTSRGCHRHTPADPDADHRCRAMWPRASGCRGNHGGFKSHIFRLSMIGACDPLDGDGDSRFAAPSRPARTWATSSPAFATRSRHATTWKSPGEHVEP